MEHPGPPTSHRVEADGDGRPMLVKVARGEAGRARLRHEAEVLHRVVHPDVVAVCDVVDLGDATELHLVWAGPHSLATVTGVPAAAVAMIVARVADVVAHLHRHDVAHGRLTPDHVLLGASDRVVVTGLADATPVDAARAADDVAALGELLTTLVRPIEDRPLVPERRVLPRHDGLRGALLTLADQAQADDPASRPRASELASLLRELVPGRDARTARPRRRPRRRRHAWTDTVAAHWRSSPRRTRLAIVGLAAAALVAIGLVAWVGTAPPAPPPSPVAAAPAPRDGHAPSPTDSAAVTTAATLTASSSTSPPPTTVPVPTTTPPTTASPPATCASDEGTVADTAGNGCPQAVRIDGDRVSVGGTTWIVGRPDDVLTLGDWDCDGVATLALLRPATGEVFVFDRWATPTDELTVRPTTTVPGAAALHVADRDGDGCSTLTVARRTGSDVEVTVRRSG